uniref:G protein gamma subunit-like protein n=1 Tax=Coptotermes formosanus TaxID=36987 RepID=R4V487_COPFO|nr:G protein gamma subunit-like protein [Coptotermes formosanus]
MDMMISNLQQQRQVTEQLRREAAIKRISVSQAVLDIRSIYMSTNKRIVCWLASVPRRRIRLERRAAALSCKRFVYSVCVHCFMKSVKRSSAWLLVHHGICGKLFSVTFYVPCKCVLYLKLHGETQP